MGKQKKYTVFISYTSEDFWIAKQIKLHVMACGADAFLFDLDSEIGENFDRRIKGQIERSKELFVLFTPNSKEKKYIWLEIGAAWMKGSKIIISLYGITETEFISDRNYPNFLKSNNLLVLNKVDNYFKQLKKRVKK